MTIACHFDLGVEDKGTVILGGSFFCSRQFDEAKQSTAIIRTIVYHLACACPSFAGTLLRTGDFDAVNYGVQAQIQDLLVKPWRASEDDRKADPSTPPCYLVVIDALDEIEGDGGSKFLQDLWRDLTLAGKVIVARIRHIPYVEQAQP